MSIDRLETLRAIEPMNDGRYSIHITRPDGRNECSRGVPFLLDIDKNVHFG